MRTMQRAIAMVGLTLMTGGVMATAATAASAAPTTGQAEKTTQSTERRFDHDRGRGNDFDRRGFRDRDGRYVVDWFRSRQACWSAAWWGDKTGQFDDPRCIKFGRYYVLTAEREHHRRGGRH